MVDILDHAVDGIGQLTFFVKLVELAEMPAVLIICQRVLNVSRNGTVNILVGTLLRGKG